jgi:Holliday junction resolvase
MGAAQRNKGVRFERELANLLSEKLGTRVTRNWKVQSGEGGHDLEGLDSFAVESKACAELSLGAWWKQTVQQAERSKRIPVLFYKQPRLNWKVVVPAHFFGPDLGEVAPVGLEHTATISIDLFVHIARFRKLA